LSLICGELTSWFLLLVIKNPYVTEFKSLAKMESLVWILPIALPIIFLVGFLVGQLLAKISGVFSQIIKFLEIGVLNTFIDTGVLNLLINITGITSGVALAPLNTVSFLCGATNSYFWNRFWTFKEPGKASSKNFFQFLIVSGIGWGINTTILVLGTTYLNPVFNLSAGAWANLIKFGSILISMVWNFVGYKFIVFKKNNG
jgi:putative flippase GtrA